MAHAINWFEVPAIDFLRARKFYEAVLNAEMPVFEAMGKKSAFFPSEMEKGEIGGCLVEGEGYEPSSSGPLIYLNGGEDLSDPLSCVEAAGGKVTLPKTSIGHNGFMAYFIDTEGNNIAFHSRK